MIKFLQKSFIISLLAFLCLFSIRLIYGYVVTPNGEPLRPYMQSYHSNRAEGAWGFADNIKNYASFKKGKDFGGSYIDQPPAGGGALDQKYEKIANMALESGKFDEDEKNIRTLITDNKALIQFEQREGLKGKRNLRLAVGVDPQKFDQFVEKAQNFGKLTELTINKSDKTNEYRQLQAKRISLEKTRDALNALKTKEGEVRAMIELEQQILSMEQQIQDLGVSLGVFDKENEFVTVKFRIQEAGAAALRNTSFFERSFTAFTWSVKYYVLLSIAFAAIAFAALIMAHLLRVVPQWLASAETSGQKEK